MIDVFPPLHAIGVTGLTANVGAEGFIKAIDVVAEQPLASVATIVYVPATKPVNVPAGDWVPEIGNMVYVFVPVPPDAVTATNPVVTQVGLLDPATLTTTAEAGSVMVKTVDTEQLFASVVTTVYVLAVLEKGLTEAIPFTVKVLVPVPPMALKVNEPVDPLHNALVTLVFNTKAAGCVIVITVLTVALLTSVATTV